MITTSIIDKLSLEIRSLINKTPSGELEKNLHALLQGTFAKFNLVTREEYDIQTQVLAKTQQKLETLESQLAALEQSIK